MKDSIFVVHILFQFSFGSINLPTLLKNSLFPNVPPSINFAFYTDPLRIVPSDLQEELPWASSFALANGIAQKTGLKLVSHFTHKRKWIGFLDDNHVDLTNPEQISSHYQKQHVFPGDTEIAEKDKFYLNAKKFETIHGRLLFLHETYILPWELETFINNSNGRHEYWLYKPGDGYESRGILPLITGSGTANISFPTKSRGIIQRFLHNPYLINGRKFELRLYALITSFNPLKVYLYKNGIVTIPRHKFSNRLQNFRRSCEFILRTECEDANHKEAPDRIVESLGWELDDNGTTYMWDKKSLWTYLGQHGHDMDMLDKKLEDILIKVMIIGSKPISTRSYGDDERRICGQLQNRYNAFEVFGIDFLFDEFLEPYLLEVNDHPTLTIGETQFQDAIRIPMLTEALNIATFHLSPTLSVKSRKYFRNLTTDDPLVFDERMYSFWKSRNRPNLEPNGSLVLDLLTPNDIRLLITAEDELSKTSKFTRVFPRKGSSKYLKYLEENLEETKLLVQWEETYGGKSRAEGRAYLKRMTHRKVHLK